MIRLGLLGTGSTTSVADWHTQGFLKDGRARICGVYNRTRDSGLRWAERFGLEVRLCGAVDELLDCCDAVVICTPNDSHLEYAMAALAAGKHILLEKPMTLSGGQARELAQAAAGAGVLCRVGYVYRFSSLIQTARKQVRDRLGRVYTVDASMGGGRLADPRVGMEWRMYAGPAGSGALHDFASHLLDTAHFITGAPYTQAFCQKETFITGRNGPAGLEPVETDDSASLCLRGGCGLGNFLVSRVGLGPMTIRIVGEGGMVRLSMGPEAGLAVWEKPVGKGYSGSERQLGLPRETVEDWFRAQAADFLDGIEGKTSLGASFSDGRYVDGLLSAALRSARSGRAEQAGEEA